MIIGFTGLMGSGKTTACEYVMKQFPNKFVRINFKDALVAEMKRKLPDVLRELARTVYPFDALTDLDANVDQLFKDKPALMRALMQNYGTEVRRGDDPDYWIIRWKAAVMNAEKAGLNVLVDDCRFLNEAGAITDVGGHIVRIVRSDITSTGTHQSETEMVKIGYEDLIEVEPGDFDTMHKRLNEVIGKYSHEAV